MEKNNMTAVEWLMNELANTGLLVTKDIDNLVAYSKAKQIEKEQMYEYIERLYVNGDASYEYHKKQFEQYYNEKYGNNE